MEEIYKQIYDSNYKISNYGNIINIKKNKILKQYISKTKYYCIKLTYNGKIHTIQVHRLVYSIFNNVELDYYDKIFHKNKNTKDNHIDNLYIKKYNKKTNLNSEIIFKKNIFLDIN